MIVLNIASQSEHFFWRESIFILNLKLFEFGIIQFFKFSKKLASVRLLAIK